MSGSCRLAVVLVADQTSSTETRLALGDVQANLLEVGLRKLIRDTLVDNGGIYLRSTGDGAIAVFEAASRAVAAAGQLHRRSRELRTASGIGTSLRVGISLGEVEYDGENLAGAQGFVMLAASRLCAAADPETTLASDGLVASREQWPGFAVSPAHEYRLKGIARPLRAHTVTAVQSETELPRHVVGLCVMPMIGREAELEEGSEFVHSPVNQSQRASALVISGPAGVGKSRLAAELCRHHSHGWVGFGAARAHHRPFASLIAALPPSVAVLLDSAESEQVEDQTTLFARVQQQLDRFAQEQSLMLIDDAHLLDPSEVDLLLFLLDHCRRPHIFLLPSRIDLAALDSRLSDHRRVGVLQLGGIGEQAARSLVRSLLPPAVATEELVDRVTAEGRGVPLMISLLAQSEGARLLASGRPDARSAGFEVHIESRLLEASEAAREILTTAAVLDSTDVELIGVVLGLAPPAVTRALDVGTDLALLSAVGSSRTFFHDVIRDSLALQVPAAQANSLHLRAAQALSDMPRGDPVLAAGHLLLADVANADARDSCERAGEWALSSSAFSSAAAWFRQSSSLTDDDDQRLRLVIRAIAAEHLAGHPEVRRSALAIGSDCLDAELPELAALALFAVDRGIFATAGMSDAKLIVLAEQIIDALPQDDPAIGRLQAMIASELTFTSGSDAARQRVELANDAIDRARDIPDIAARAQIFALCCMALRDADSIPERYELCRELHAMSEMLQDDWVRFEANLELGAAALEHCEVVEANQCARAAVALADSLGQPRALWLAGLMETALEINSGNLDLAVTARNRATQAGIQAGFELEAHFTSGEQALEIERWRGSLHERRTDLAGWAGDSILDITFAGLKYLVLAGGRREADEWLHAVELEETVASGPKITEGPKLINLTPVLMECAGSDVLRRHYARLSHLCGTWFQTTVSLGCTDHHAAMVAAKLGLASEASSHAIAALRYHDRHIVPLWWTETVIESHRWNIDLGMGNGQYEHASRIREQIALSADAGPTTITSNR